MKKIKVAAGISAFLALCMLASGCSSQKYESIYSRAVPSFQVREDGSFKVLQITDTHLLGGTKFDKDNETLRELEKAVTTLDYDLVVMTGDLVINEGLKLYYNKYNGVRRFADLMEKHGVYWAYTLGNHEGAIIGNNESIIKTLLPYEHCIIGNTEQVDGETNFVVDLKKQDKTVHSLILMDSHDKDKEQGTKGYDYIKQSQIDWYKAVLKARGNVPSTLFMHIPLPEFREADKAGQFDGSGEVLRLDGICAPTYNSGFFDVIKSQKSTGMVSVGHDHNNRWGAWYQGVYFMYARVSGFNAWGLSEKVAPGVTMITIRTGADTAKGMYQVEDIKFSSIK